MATCIASRQDATRKPQYVREMTRTKQNHFLKSGLRWRSSSYCYLCHHYQARSKWHIVVSEYHPALYPRAGNLVRLLPHFRTPIITPWSDYQLPSCAWMMTTLYHTMEGNTVLKAQTGIKQMVIHPPSGRSRLPLGRFRLCADVIRRWAGIPVTTIGFCQILCSSSIPLRLSHCLSWPFASQSPIQVHTDCRYVAIRDKHRSSLPCCSCLCKLSSVCPNTPLLLLCSAILTDPGALFPSPLSLVCHGR